MGFQVRWDPGMGELCLLRGAGPLALVPLQPWTVLRKPGSLDLTRGSLARSAPPPLLPDPGVSVGRGGGAAWGWGQHWMQGCLVAEPRPPSRSRELGFGFKAPSLPSFLLSLPLSLCSLPPPFPSFLQKCLLFVMKNVKHTQAEME